MNTNAPTTTQANLEQAPAFHCPSYAEGSVELPHDISFGAVSSSGFVAAFVVKIAALYAANHNKIAGQIDCRSSTISFFRPIIPTRGHVYFKTYELSIGKSWSTLRIEVLQQKLSVVADVLLTRFDVPGLTLHTDWSLNPSPILAHSLAALENGSDPAWACYHKAFHANGFRSAHAFVKNYILRDWPDRNVAYIDQYLVPGWDCNPSGSRDPALPEGRCTNELLPFAADSHLPVQTNYLNPDSGENESGEKQPLLTVAAALGFAAAQERAREQGKAQWREVDGDGALTFGARGVHSTLSMNLEMKKKLPVDGIRFLFTRAEVKSIIDGRLDIQVLIFDESVELVLVGQQVAQLVEAATKTERAIL